MLLAPSFIGGRGLNEPGIPLANGGLGNLAVGNGDPLTCGHVVVGADSCWAGAALFFTTCSGKVMQII